MDRRRVHRGVPAAPHQPSAGRTRNRAVQHSRREHVSERTARRPYRRAGQRLPGPGPPRGQIVVFKFPPDGKTDYIKRVVGLPGDRIQLRAELLFINDQLVPREAAPNPVDEDASGRRLHIYRETLPDGVTHLIAESSDDEMLDNTEVFTVPAGHVFMLGDNRDHSADSRISDGVGYVPLALLRDKPLFVLWSTNTSRIGARIE